MADHVRLRWREGRCRSRRGGRAEGGGVYTSNNTKIIRGSKRCGLSMWFVYKEQGRERENSFSLQLWRHQYTYWASVFF